MLSRRIVKLFARVRKLFGRFVLSKPDTIVRFSGAPRKSFSRSLLPRPDGESPPCSPDYDAQAVAHGLSCTPLLDERILSDTLDSHDVQLLCQWLLKALQEPDNKKILASLDKNDVQDVADFLQFAVYDVQVPQTEEINTLASTLETLGIFPNLMSLRGIERLDHDESSELIGVREKYKYRGGLELCAEVIAPDHNISLKLVQRLICLSHENVLPFYGVYDVGDGPPRVLTPCLDYSLGDYVEAHAGRRELILLTIDIIKGVGYLHDLGMVHGSLRSDTVFVTSQGRALLGTISYDDFLVNIRDQRSNIVSSAPPSLSVSYNPPTSHVRWMAPEQIDSPSLKPTTKSDIWAFGCLVYLILTTKNPYHEYNHNILVLRSIIYRIMPTLNSEKPVFDFPEFEALWGVMERCWTPDAAQRPKWRTILESLNTFAYNLVIQPSKVKSTREFWQDARANSDINITIRLGRVRGLLPKSHQVSGEEIHSRLVTLNGLPNLKDGCRSILDGILEEERKERRERLVRFERPDAQLLCDYLDEVFCDATTGYEPKLTRQRILSLLDRLGKYAQVFPRRYILRNIKVDLSKPIAEGGFASVYKGRLDGSFVVGLKVMKQMDAIKLSRSYARELTLWAHLSHPNILPFCGVFSVPESGALALVSPWMQRGNLRDYALGLSQIERQPYILGVINGLDFLHSEDIVHGDLKAQNVLISDDGRALIADFGLSSFDPGLMFTANSLTASTFSGRWAAPEMLLNADKGETPPTKPADVWSLACLIYEVLSTRLPYWQYTQIVKVIVALMREELPAQPVEGDPSTGEYIEKDLWEALTKCWKFGSKERPTCGDILKDFEQLLTVPPRPTHKGSTGTESLYYGKRRSKKIDYERVYQLLRASDIDKGERMSYLVRG